MPTIAQAIAIAASAHAGHLAENGEPYIFHPLRVMLKLVDIEEQIVGVLHDVVEKTAWTLVTLRSEGFSEHVLVAIDAVTRRHGEDYEDFVERTKINALARRVKIADLEDNIQTVQMQVQDDKSRDKLAKYTKALRVLSGGMDTPA
ncbi:HD domain-containing protein [Phyllobacterium sp. CL33Tsu]|uniref:HD domain-containing protein n=1 Tax=Phyllobacterium sp. CL33Tsu TaxID=1798191 RepID=UPI0008EB7FDC|nr:HD domain-containing protein [Phyllobacterium sp. CL33Tsu]SFJ55671.1 HD domain-containing protein [Phyllobacterium sp. CL33Tsu]